MEKAGTVLGNALADRSTIIDRLSNKNMPAVQMQPLRVFARKSLSLLLYTAQIL